MAEELSGFSYKSVFDKTLMEIRILRKPSSKRADECFYNWDDVKKNEYFNFGGQRQEEYTKLVEFARKRSIDTIRLIIELMNKTFGKQLQFVSEYEKEGLLSKVHFVIFDACTKELYFFKEIEECVFMLGENLGSEIESIMQIKDATDYKFIYFVKDKAYLQQIGYDLELEDAGKGTVAYPLLFFFESVFGKEETKRFSSAFEEYLEAINKTLGYSVIKTLTADAAINFRNIVESKLVKYKYEHIKEMNIGRYSIDKRDIPKLINQFINKKYYRVLLGSKNFAESFITAEWMYDTMKKAQAVDLSVIALGYFKTIEQLLFEVIKIFHSGSELNEDDFPLGSIATYYKRFNSYEDDIHRFTKSYIKEYIFYYKDLRNGYSHKHNIIDEDKENKIDKIRDATYDLAFLVLGSHKFNDERLSKLGYEERKYENDFYYFCEYMHHHAGDAIYIYIGDVEIMCFADNDMNAKNKGKIIEYSGVYFHGMLNKKKWRIYVENSGCYIQDMESKEKWRISENSIPIKVILGRVKIVGKHKIEELSIEKVKVVFENGKFLGPHVRDEIEEEY